MNRFSQIDSKLKSFADNLSAKIFTSGSGFQVDGMPVPEQYVQERRIIWFDDTIGKAILINPNFQGTDFASPSWDFFNLAWLEKETKTVKGKPFWQKYLLRKTEFKAIENDIDSLLEKSLTNLERITLLDLR